MRKILGVLLGTLLAASATAKEHHIAYAWDVDAAALTYPALVGLGGSTGGGLGQINVPIQVQTSGSSTTVSATVASSAPFTGLAVDDVVIFVRDGVVSKRVIVTFTNADTIVVDTAITLAAGNFSYYKFRAGTTAADGWVDMAGLGDSKTIQIQWEQGDLATGLLYVIECMTSGLDPQPAQVFPTTTCGLGTLTTLQCLIPVASVGTSTIGRVQVELTADQKMCRVGVLRSGADASDATTNRERVSISVFGNPAE